MNELLKTNNTLNLKKLNDFVSQNKGYACIVLGMFIIRDLCIKAMDKDYSFKFNANKEGVSLNLDRQESISC